MLRTYAPVAVDGGFGVVALYQDYDPIAAAATATFVPVVGIFEAVLSRFVLASALSQCREWKAAGLDLHVAST